MSRRGLLLSLCCATVSGFAPIQTVSRSDSSLNAFNPVNGMIERATASLALGSVILSNVAVWPAIAFDQPDFGSSQIIAARSGGRAGGRSSSSAYKASPKVRAAQKAAPAPVIIRETRIVTTPSYGGGYGGGQAVMMAPQPMMMAQPGIPGLGVIAGLGAVNAIGGMYFCL